MFDGQMAYEHSGNAPVYAPNSGDRGWADETGPAPDGWERSEEHTSELQSLMRISYAVFCLKKKNKKKKKNSSISKFDNRRARYRRRIAAERQQLQEQQI